MARGAVVSVRARLAAVVLAMLATVVLAPAALAVGLSAYVADATLPAVAYSHAARASSGTLSLTAEDTSGTDGGWNVTVQSSAFTYSGPNAGADIPASNFSLAAAAAPTLISGQAIDSVGGPKVPAADPTGTLDLARKTLHAAAGFGKGTYGQALEVSLLVPGMARAGTYTAALTVTILSGP